MQNKIVVTHDKKCLLWHSWRLVMDTGETQYHECDDCEARRVMWGGEGGYQPIDTDWVVGLKLHYNAPFSGARVTNLN